jgi:hypothetical protein
MLLYNQGHLPVGVIEQYVPNITKITIRLILDFGEKKAHPTEVR